MHGSQEVGKKMVHRRRLHGSVDRRSSIIFQLFQNKQTLLQQIDLALEIHPPKFRTTTSASYAISTLAHFPFWLRNKVISSLALVLTIVPQGKIQTR